MDPNDSTLPSASRQGKPPPFIAADVLTNTRALDCCPSAQTLYAYSADLRADVLIVLPCKRWTCRPCHAVKVRKYAYKVRLAQPNRLLTLTVDPKLWPDPEDAYRSTTKSVAILARKLRLRFASFEYFRCTEVTKKGWPHYHLLVRSPYLPQPVVKQLWEDLTGALIVDLRQVKKSFEAYLYVVKYLGKVHKLPWGTRHLAWSKSFFVNEPKPPKNRYNILEPQHIDQHPADFLSGYHTGRTVTKIENNLYTLT